MEVSQEKWAGIFHNTKEPWNCKDRKRPLGCSECDVIDSTGFDKKGNSFILSIVGDVHANIPALLSHSKKKYNQIITMGDMCMYTSLSEAEKDKKSIAHNKSAILKFLSDEENNNLTPFHVPVKSILGNHDNFVNLENDTYKYLNFNYVKNGTVLKIGNLVIATLGGIYSPNKFFWETSKLKEYNKRFFTSEDIKSLLEKTKNTKVDILITHQAASGVLPKMASGVDEGSPYLTELLQELNPKYYLHGHHHKEYKTLFGNTQVFGLGNFKLNNNTYVDFNMLTGEIILPN